MGKPYLSVQENQICSLALQFCLAAVTVICDAGLIPSELVYPQFPHLKTVDHGYGATSYQNVQVQNYGSVPIPKDLQVDDGHEYHHTQYLHHDELSQHQEVPSKEIQHYQDSHNDLNHVVLATQCKKIKIKIKCSRLKKFLSACLVAAPYGYEDHVQQVKLEPQQYSPPSHYGNYDHEVEYEYH